MKSNLLKQFKKRFERINKIEKRIAKKVTLKEKLQQLSSMISMAFELGINFNKDKKTQMLNNNWAFLKS
jgi:hypothetical protein